MDAATRATRLSHPGAQRDLPHAREQYSWIARVHYEVARACLRIHEEHLLPRLAPVARPVNAALLLRRVAMPDGRYVHHVRVVGVYDDAADPARRVESHVRPVLAGVRRLPHAVSEGHVGSEERLPGAGPYDIRVGRRHGDLPDRVHWIVIEDRAPAQSRVVGLPDSPRCRTGVVRETVTDDPRHRRDAVPDRTDVPVLHLGQISGGDLLCPRIKG